ncbi:sensor histidine kinase [Ekhidna sp. To15]|uniref:sensor histidine kinase n=1 Tax=Ekhidna sp. To15 TaxID=3395267 RepID=UPI003F51EF49
MKYRFRFTIAVFVFFFFKLTRVENWEEFVGWDEMSTISLIYTISVIMILWEVVSRFVHWQSSNLSIRSNIGLYKISTKATLLVIPLVFLFAFLYNEFLADLGCCDNGEKRGSFLLDSAQGFVISLLIIAYEIIILYVRNAIRSAREKEAIQRELAAAKLESLKNQVNPHFLFNSFSVLSCLVEDNSKQAIKFISKLSDMYRYILENDEKSVVTLQEEMEFLDSYIFLLKMRHQEAIVVEKDISLVNLNLTVPPMSIQILVENAIKHNSFSVDEPLYISIKNEGDKSIVVENAKRKKESLSSSTKIGLKNLSNRLLLSAGRALEITDSEETFTVRLPLSLS